MTRAQASLRVRVELEKRLRATEQALSRALEGPWPGDVLGPLRRARVSLGEALTHLQAAEREFSRYQESGLDGEDRGSPHRLGQPEQRAAN